MKKELEDMLCEYLGELMCQAEKEFDWMEKDLINEKINAVNYLLGFYQKKKGLLQQFQDYLKQST